METYNDSDDNGLAIVMDGDKDQSVQSDTEHAPGQVDPEGDEEVRLEGGVIVIQNMLLEKYYIYKEGYDEVGVVPTNDEAVAGVDGGLNSSPGRVWSDNGSLSLASCSDLVSWHQVCCVSQELSQLEERDIEGGTGIGRGEHSGRGGCKARLNISI